MTAPAQSKTSFGPYDVLEQLGVGGMCRVFRAVHRETGSMCALKVLREERRLDEQVRDLFITEADLSMLLDHSNLIKTYDAGEVDGRYYIAMELIEGATLQQFLERAGEQGVKIPLDVLLYVVTEVLSGLHALHVAKGRTGRLLGLVHRDVTPQNIFLSFDGRVIVGDFGVAHIQAYGDANPGMALGKLGYLSPEMILDEEVDQRADIFAAGVVTHELLSGNRLFDDGTDEEIMDNIVEGRIAKLRRSNSTMTKELESAVMKALSIRPKDRYLDAASMAKELAPHWDKRLASPYGMAALMIALFKDEALAARASRASLSKK